MSRHKNQHLIPACYLKNFISNEIPEDHLDKNKFENGVYICKDIFSKDWKMKSINNDFFKKVWYYSPEENLYVEKELGSIEGAYAKAVKNINENKILSIEDKKSLSEFFITMHFRTESFQDRFQNFIRDIFCVYTDMKNKLNNIDSEKNIDKKDINNEINDLSKILIVDKNMKRIFEDIGIMIIVNETNIPFITSENPAVNEKLYTEDINLIFGENILNGVGEDAFFYMPISPYKAICFHKKFNELEESYIKINKPISVHYLNYYIYIKSDRYLISDKKNSLNELFLEECSRNKKIQKSSFGCIYTNKNRCNFCISSTIEIENGIRIKCKSLYEYNEIKDIKYPQKIEISLEGKIINMMNDINILNFNDDNFEFDIVSKIKIPSNKFNNKVL